MHILRVLHAGRLLWCLGMIGVLACSGGCDSGAPIAEIEASTGGEHGKAEQDARIKAFGASGQQKTEMPKRR